MEHKVLAIDLDGTLLSKFKHISNENLMAIKTYVQAGGLPIITTGRSIISAKEYANEINSFTGSNSEYVVAFNGAYIYNTTTEKVESFKIPHDLCRALYDYCKAHKLSMWAYTDESLNQKSVHVTKHWLNPFVRLSNRLNTMTLNDHVSDMSSYKVNIMSFRKSKVKAAYGWLKNQFADKLNVSFSHKNLLEVNLFGVNKGAALKKISKEIKIPLEKFAAIGDSNNDLPALNVVSLPIAVKTHSKELVQAAKYYLPYKRNAVADAINKYVLDNDDNKIKLILSDLDGTLLRNGSKTISTSTIKSIIDAVDNYGIYFAIASGRNIDDALLVLKDIKVKNKNRLFIIAANGAVVYDPSKKQIILQKTIEPYLARELFESYKLIYDDKRHKGQMALQIYTPNDLATVHKPQISYVLNWKYFNIHSSKGHPGIFKHYWNKRNAIPLTDEYDFANVLKFVFVFESPEDKARVAASLDKFKSRMEISSSGTANIEVMPPYVTKGSALEHLCAYLNIDVKNTMPIGDELNDIPMLILSKHSVTMKTSKESVRKAAGHVLDSETSDIVGAAINKYVLGK